MNCLGCCKRGMLTWLYCFGMLETIVTKAVEVGILLCLDVGGCVASFLLTLVLFRIFTITLASSFAPKDHIASFDLLACLAAGSIEFSCDKHGLLFLITKANIVLKTGMSIAY